MGESICFSVFLFCCLFVCLFDCCITRSRNLPGGGVYGRLQGEEGAEPAFSVGINNLQNLGLFPILGGKR